MFSLTQIRWRAGAGAALAGASLLVAGCGSSASSTAASSSSASAAAATTSSTATAQAVASTSMSTMVKLAHGAHGTYLVGPNGRALYLWMADKNGKSSCSGGCAQAWPPLVAKGKPGAGAGVKAGELGTTARSDGSMQVTYDGHPLYYFVADTKPGMTSGEGSDGFGAKWWLVSPSGTAITTGGSSGGSGGGSSSGSSSSSGGGWG